jgi:endonuclease YncB( thermonuclease family)
MLPKDSKSELPQMSKVSRPRSRLVSLDNWLNAVLAIGIVLMVGVYLPSGAPRGFAGPARVVDGNSLYVGTVATRLDGIDAPDAGQFCELDGEPWHCGKAATSALHALIGGRNVWCDGEGRDLQDRILAVCRAGDVDLNSEMVALGWAVADGAYLAQEKEARAASLGLWSGEFERPSLWRQMFNGT